MGPTLKEYKYMYRGWRFRRLTSCGVQVLKGAPVREGQAAAPGAWPWQTQVGEVSE